MYQALIIIKSNTEPAAMSSQLIERATMQEIAALKGQMWACSDHDFKYEVVSLGQTSA